MARQRRCNGSWQRQDTAARHRAVEAVEHERRQLACDGGNCRTLNEIENAQLALLVIDNEDEEQRRVVAVYKFGTLAPLRNASVCVRGCSEGLCEMQRRYT